MVGDTLAYADFDYITDLIDLPNQAYSYRVITSEHNLEKQKEISQILDEYLTDRDFLINGITAGLVIQEDNARAINILVVFLMIMAPAPMKSLSATASSAPTRSAQTRSRGNSAQRPERWSRHRSTTAWPSTTSAFPARSACVRRP